MLCSSCAVRDGSLTSSVFTFSPAGAESLCRQQFYSGVMHDREGAFIRRYGFTIQLMREDDEGKR